MGAFLPEQPYTGRWYRSKPQFLQAGGAGIPVFPLNVLFIQHKFPCWPAKRLLVLASVFQGDVLGGNYNLVFTGIQSTGMYSGIIPFSG